MLKIFVTPQVKITSYQKSSTNYVINAATYKIITATCMFWQINCVTKSCFLRYTIIN
ncbi:MAG: hypothetical protein HYX39_05485 [Bacteroidetes bacterium]|nr:hypothetical protein [Bacteroidota bacterium]